MLMKTTIMKTMVIDNGNANNDEMVAGGAEKPKCDRKYPPEAQTLLVPLGRDKKIVLIGFLWVSFFLASWQTTRNILILKGPWAVL